MTRSRLCVLALLATLVLVACDPPTVDPQQITTGDPDFYASYVQPYLEAGCATLDCHGDPGHPLRLYAQLGLREKGTLRASSIAEHNEPTAITEAELEDNRLSLAALALATEGSSEHIALLNPMAVATGGIAHEGPTLWSSRQAPGYLCLRAYLLDEPSEQPANACAEALDALQSAVPSAD
jgi:hypothetical protein